jgi:hypothetical protein
VAHVPAIQKAGMHEAARIAQALMQREATMAVIASAGERVDRARAERLAPPTHPERLADAPDRQPGGEGGRGHRRRDETADDQDSGRHIDLTA